MWKTISASVTGTSHRDQQLGCQDSHGLEVFSVASGSWLLALAADGAGSAVNAAVGSALACQTLTARVAEYLAKTARPVLDAGRVHGWLADARAAIDKHAAEAGLGLRDYATTLAAALVGEREALFFQIGDGAMIVDRRDCQGVVFWPDSGLYANMTYFLTDDDYRDHVQVQHSRCGFDEVAVFSDGIQRLALSFEYRSVHRPFFEGLYTALRQTAPQDCAALSARLAQFLDSPAVNSRTDDDKTLILATRRTG